MRTETFSCNLCGEERKQDELFAMVWTGVEWSFALDVTKSHRHICSKCIKFIREADPK